MSPVARGSHVVRPRSDAGAFVCELATADDDEALRRLMREGAMEGWVRLAFPTEPSYFGAAALEGRRGATIVVRRERDGSVVAMGSRSVKEVYLRGRPALLGYLGRLRFAPGWRGGRRTLARGYAMARSLRRPDELPFDLTAVVADNAPARRLLERGLRGMPRYTPLEELVTLVLPTGRPNPPGARRTVDPASRVEDVKAGSAGGLSERAALDAVADRLERERETLDLAPRWSRPRLAELASGRLGPWYPLLARDGSGVRGCAAVWDQRPLRQCVVRGYAPWLGRLRPALNLGLRVVGRPRLPAPGSSLRLGYLSHLAADDAETLSALVTAARARASRQGLDRLALALPAGRPELRLLRRRFGGHTYGSILYAVHERAVDPDSSGLDGRRLAVEVATL